VNGLPDGLKINTDNRQPGKRDFAHACLRFAVGTVNHGVFAHDIFLWINNPVFRDSVVFIEFLLADLVVLYRLR